VKAQFPGGVGAAQLKKAALSDGFLVPGRDRSVGLVGRGFASVPAVSRESPGIPPSRSPNAANQPHNTRASRGDEGGSGTLPLDGGVGEDGRGGEICVRYEPQSCKNVFNSRHPDV